MGGHTGTRQPEGVEISVLVDTPVNPPLLGVQIAAPERAQGMIAEQIAAFQTAMDEDRG